MPYTLFVTCSPQRGGPGRLVLGGAGAAGSAKKGACRALPGTFADPSGGLARAVHKPNDFAVGTSEARPAYDESACRQLRSLGYFQAS